MMKGFLMFLLTLLVGVVAFAQVVEPTNQEVIGFVQSLGGWKALGAMGIAIAVVQGLLLAFRSHFVVLDPKLKLLVVTGLTWIAGVLALVSTGMPVMAALLHSQTLAALQVFANQVYQKFTEPKVETSLAN